MDCIAAQLKTYDTVQNPDGTDGSGASGFALLPCRPSSPIALPRPAMQWTCGLAVQGNFTCMGGAALGLPALYISL